MSAKLPAASAKIPAPTLAPITIPNVVLGKVRGSDRGFSSPISNSSATSYSTSEWERRRVSPSPRFMYFMAVPFVVSDV
jgi:hypothetical protein